jgi:hypothetical protein
MKFDWLHRRAREIVAATLSEEEPEVEQMLVADALIIREGNHFRIAQGGESWDELADSAQRHDGLCDCGALLSARGEVLHCRACGREYTRH